LQSNKELVIQSEQKPRYLSIDVFRGLTISVMVFVNFVAEYSSIPAWSKHAVDIGLTYVDLVASFFVFAIGLTYHMGFWHYEQKVGTLENCMRHLRRYAALIGLGMLVEQTLTLQGFYFRWAALQSIGIAGLFTYFFIRFSRKIRLVIAIIGLIAYQIFLQTTLNIDGTDITVSDLNLADVHGGLFGAIGFGLILLLSTVVCEAFETKKMYEFLIFGAIFTILGIITHFIWGISKNRVSVPYILISVGLASFLFYGIWYLYDYKHITHDSSRFFQPQGKNAIFLYALHGALTLVMRLLIPEDSAFYLVTIIGFVFITLIWLVGVILDKKKVYIIL
jgi:predicted acyltransferase